IALKNAQNASNAKSDFLANMSHEMRTPLNAIIGLSELVIESSGLSMDAVANLEKINSAGMTLLSTVNDILDISKIEAGKFELVPVEYDLSSLINDTITQSVLYIGSKPVDFILNIDENLPAYLYGDELRIKQMLNNLLSNAFKYTKTGKVELGIRCEQKEEVVSMVLQVSDTGIGIRNEDLNRLFSDYTKLDLKSNRQIEGTGLGLPITKRIAEMMGGSISLESRYGKGSVFTVTIRQQFVSNATIGAEVAKSLKSFQYSTRRRRNSRITRINMSYARVLVVDDVATNLDVARGMMKPYNMRIDCVYSGKEAVDAVREEKVRYNAIFMDHMMPEMDGIEAVRIIREEIGTEYARTVPIIALTANAIIGNEKMFLSKGFQAFLPKPIEISNLDAILRQWVRDKKHEEKLAHAVIAEQLEAEHGWVPAIEGIDFQQGIDRFNGDIEAYLNVLHSYAANTLSILDKIRKVNRNNLPQYAAAIHGIRGSSLGICANRVGAQAQALEQAAKANDFDYVAVNNKDLVSDAEKLIADILDSLGKISMNNPKPEKDKPDAEILSKLHDACLQYDMDSVDAAMTELEAYEYKTGGNFVCWLRDNVDKMNFKEIKEKLADVRK
ncbi:MAG: response regulator, partial [Fibromonadaceae bacterium]|nr:response regulator [Fibromonadaceae bacterium]